MKTWAPRFSLVLLLAFAAALLALGAAVPKGPVKQPDKLLIISVTDVKGRTNPCG